MFEEGEHNVAVEIGHGECMWSAMGSLGGKQNEQPKRISIALNSGRCCVSLSDKALAEERLEKNRER